MHERKTIDIELSEDGDDKYQGLIRLQDGTTRQFYFEPLSTSEQVLLHAFRNAVRGIGDGEISSSDLIPLGGGLYNRLFAAKSVQEILPHGPDGLIRLYIHDSAELQSWPWEILHDGLDWLFLNPKRPLIRLLPPAQHTPSIHSKDSLTIAIHGASMSTASNFNLRLKQITEMIKETLSIRDALSKRLLKLDDKTADTPADSPSLQDLVGQIVEQPDILCLMCHGEPGKLILKEQSTELGYYEEFLDATALNNNYLKKHHTPLFVVVAACDSSAVEEEQGIKVDGFVQELAEQNPDIGAVLGMQFPILETQIASFLATFFAAIANHVPLERAFVAARSRLATNSDSIPLTAFAPVLYTRLKDGIVLLPKWEIYDGPVHAERDIPISKNARVNRPLFSEQRLLLDEHVRLEAYAYGRAGVDVGSGATIEAGIVSAGPITIGDYSEVDGTLLSLNGDCTVGDNCEIDGQIVTTGPVTVGNGCRIDSIYTDSAVTVGSYCHVDAIRAQQVTLGEGCRVRVVDLIDPQAEALPESDGWFAVPQAQLGDADYRRFIRTDSAVAGTPDRLLAPGSLVAFQRIDTLRQRLSSGGS